MKDFGNLINLWITQESLYDTDHLQKLVSEAADKGFEGVNAFIRSPSIEPGDAEAVAAYRLVCDVARRRGIKVTAHVIPSPAQSFQKRYPDACTYSLDRVAVPVKAGRPVEVRLNYPLSSPESRFSHVAGVYLLEGHQGGDSYESYSDLTAEWVSDFEIESVIRLDRPRKARAFADRVKQVVSHGTAPVDGLLVFYGLFRVGLDLIGSPQGKEWTDMILEHYRNLPLDGVNWDEPGLHTGADNANWQRRFWSETVRQQAIKLAREDILPKCVLLDYRIEGTNWSVLRQVYYRSLINCLRDGHLCMKKKAREIFGPEVEVGIHQTWSEHDSKDLFVGDIDYFYLADALTSGYVDSQWYFGDEETVYSNVLARSLARKTETDCAYNNSWDYAPREERLDRVTQLMALNQVHFSHIGLGDDSAVCYPHHRIWNLMPNYLARLKRIQGMLQDLRPSTDVAAVHSWESLPRINNDRIHAHRFALVYLAYQSNMDSRAFDFVGTDMFVSAKVEGDKISFGRDSYRTLIIPWPLVLPSTVIETLDSFIDGGGRVVLFGPPPVEDTLGESTTEHFARWLGGASVGEDSAESIDPACDSLDWIGEDGVAETLLPCYDSERKMEIRARERLHVEDVTLPCYCIKPDSAQVFLRWKDKPVGIASADGRVRYIAFDFVYYEEIIRRLLDDTCTQRRLVVPEGVVFREFLPADSMSKARGYVFVARSGNKMIGCVDVGGETLDLNDKGVVAVRLEGDSLTSVAKD